MYIRHFNVYMGTLSALVHAVLWGSGGITAYDCKLLLAVSCYLIMCIFSDVYMGYLFLRARVGAVCTCEFFLGVCRGFAWHGRGPASPNTILAKGAGNHHTAILD